MWFLILLGLISGGMSDQDAAQRYLRGAQLYAAEDYAGAEALMAPLSQENTVVRPLALYALGNIRVRQASTSPTPAANALLLEAITYYRKALDLAAGSKLNLDDTRHNLELAKRLRREQKSGGQEQRAGQPPQGDVATSDQEGPGKPLTDPDAEGSPTEVGNAEADEAAPVRRSKGGLAAIDPGPLDPNEARKRLDTAIKRIEREQRVKLKVRSIDPRRSKGDY